MDELEELIKMSGRLYVKKIITRHPTLTEAWVSSLNAVQNYKVKQDNLAL